MNQVFTTLPDDRPVTAICVVENPDKCPQGFYVVSKTYDQDSDADLWREGGFFARKIARYLCLSKTEGVAGRLVESIKIISERDTPPEGYSVPAHTMDTGQKAWRKKRLCYKIGHVNSSTSAVTDVIVLSRMKKSPEEFSLSGDINGMTLCHKIGKVPQPSLVIPYSVRPMLPVPTPPDYVNALAPSLQDQLVLRKAPPPPPASHATYATISGFGGLEGVPFILNPNFKFADDSSSRRVSSILPIKTSSQIDREFSYDFRAERAT